jgi:hypothetical protein
VRRDAMERLFFQPHPSGWGKHISNPAREGGAHVGRSPWTAADALVGPASEPVA